MRHDGPVVIALDGSPHSEQTLAWGLAEAEMRRSDVVLARCSPKPRPHMPSGWYPSEVDERPFDAVAKDYLADQQRVTSARRPTLTITTRLLHGPEVPELRALSEEAQLLVLGARGYAGHARIGRVAAHLAAHARCTVAVVREAVDEPAAPVVVGVDGSPSSMAAVQIAAREALLRGAALVVVHARPSIPAPYGIDGLRVAPMATADPDDPTHRAASSVAVTLRAEHPGLDVRLEMVDDDPAHALTRLSRGAALLVVGSRGIGAFKGTLLGAVSNEVVRSASATVLVVHEDPTD